MNKYKKPLFVFLLAVIINVAGAWAKIAHQPFADTLLLLGMLAQSFAVAWAAFLMFSKKNKAEN